MADDESARQAPAAVPSTPPAATFVALEFNVPRRKDCPHCGANCWTDEARCWHCGKDLWRLPVVRPVPKQFSISTMLLVTLAVAVSFGLCRVSPLLTIVGLLWSLPAIIHAQLACNIAQSSGASLPSADRVVQLLVSFGCVFATWGASLLVLVVVYGCLGLPVVALEPIAPVSVLVAWLILSALAAVAAAIVTWFYVFRISLPRAKD